MRCFSTVAAFTEVNAELATEMDESAFFFRDDFFTGKKGATHAIEKRCLGQVVGPMGVLRRAGPAEEEGAAYTAVSALSDRSGERVGDLWVTYQE